MKNKISLFCDVETAAVIETLDAETIYEVPLMFEEAGLADLVVKRLQLPKRSADLTEWRQIVERMKDMSSFTSAIESSPPCHNASIPPRHCPAAWTTKNKRIT